ncbi:Mitochondrial import inner membrane translocase subunit tim16 [Salinomyces thailandicus]|uniref:Mitochondrial import inner membrane translocase subunit TIM16 n=1 Tax=Salinomyces thailandicus TaxID=706561 RepID=A0A4U0TVX7_9PEZI|nr:Mitochondrial import inner membrane translocase subunit tim16 [Salinomyces thailandica]
MDRVVPASSAERGGGGGGGGGGGDGRLPKTFLMLDDECEGENPPVHSKKVRTAPLIHSTNFPSLAGADMAHRIISQVVFTGARVFGRAFAEAYKQASASQKYAAGNSTAGNSTASGITLDEACRILNVAPPKGGQSNVERTHEQFKRLFDMNDPKKGGSFYLQSKVLRARERVEMEVRVRVEEGEREEELRRGWRPRVYRDR